MVTIKSWKAFEKDIILKDERFYLYGVSAIFRKIIYVIQDRVKGILDKRADEIEESGLNIEIIKPQEIMKDTEDKIAILSVLNPFTNYIERTEMVKEELKKSIHGKEINLYCLDYNNIKNTGIINWAGKNLLIDNMLCLVNYGNELPHMKLAYNHVKIFDASYLQKLYEEPIEFRLYGNKIGLIDFDNELITHINGNKKTIRKYEDSYYEHNIWIFGDSRISGMLIENSDTIASFLQKAIDGNKLKYRVLNCGIPGRDIERMVYQIRTEEIQEGDYVILATGFYEYDGNVNRNAVVWSEFIKKAYEICRVKKAEFMYINLPTILEMTNLNSIEKDMLELFNTTEFRNYSYEKIQYYVDLINYRCIKSNVAFYNFAYAFAGRDTYGQVFINLHHYSAHGNRLIADEMFRLISILEKGNSINNESVRKEIEKRETKFANKLNALKKQDEEIWEYIESIKKDLVDKDLSNKKIGCIVMNANPFTKGHMFLVQTALKKIDFLIVFVVSEDASFFKFSDRFYIIRENLKMYKNVLVVPSGKFCISKQTFPEYFKKEDLQKENINVKNDLEIFAEKIAPNLNISVRFVGEEPEDAVTKQYNEAMKLILPQRNIEVVEIPRMKIANGKVISASIVRKLISEHKIEEIKELVPLKTYQFIEQKYK